jgi:low affinity Fe/Cu permease
MGEQNSHRIAESFTWLASKSGEAMGSASAFVVATLAVLLWAVSGPWFHYSDTWQLIINTATTVLTFLAVFLIQHSQNRDSRAIQLKLDELIKSTKNARDRLIDLEHCTDDEMRELQEEFAKVQRKRGQNGPSSPARAELAHPQEP